MRRNGKSFHCWQDDPIISVLAGWGADAIAGLEAFGSLLKIVYWLLAARLFSQISHLSKVGGEYRICC